MNFFNPKEGVETRKDNIALILFQCIVNIPGLISSVYFNRQYFNELIKPSFLPTEAAFYIISWYIIYSLMGLSLYVLWEKGRLGLVPCVYFITHFCFNLCWSYCFSCGLWLGLISHMLICVTFVPFYNSFRKLAAINNFILFPVALYYVLAMIAIVNMLFLNLF